MLRPIEPSDLDLLYEIENDSRMWAYSYANEPYSKQLLTEYLTSITGDIYADKQLRLVIENESKQAVGLIDLSDFEPRHRRAAVGIVVVAEFRRHGYALQSLNEIARYARDVVGIHQLYATISVKNEASIGLFSKAGYVRTGLLRHWFCRTDLYEDGVLMQLEL